MEHHLALTKPQMLYMEIFEIHRKEKMRERKDIIDNCQYRCSLYIARRVLTKKNLMTSFNVTRPVITRRLQGSLGPLDALFTD